MVNITRLNVQIRLFHTLVLETAFSPRQILKTAFSPRVFYIINYPYLRFLTAAGNIDFLRTVIRLTTCPLCFTSTSFLCGKSTFILMFFALILPLLISFAAATLLKSKFIFAGLLRGVNLVLAVISLFFFFNY